MYTWILHRLVQGRLSASAAYTPLTAALETWAMPKGACPLPSGAAASELSRKGYDLLRAEDHQNALDCHMRATELDPLNVYSHFHRSQAELALGLDQRAKESLERAIVTKHITLETQVATEAYFHLGKIARDAGDAASAVQHYKRAIELKPSAPGAHIMLGVALRDLGRLEEALDAYSIGLKIGPNIPAAQFNRAQLLISLQRKAEAIKALQKTISIDPTFYLAYTALGDELSAQKRHSEALAAHEAVVALQPNDISAHYAVGKVHFTMRRLPLAIEAHTRALALPETDQVPHAYIHNDLGNALSDASGRASDALEHYENAARLMPRFAEALSNVGTSLKEKGRHEDAARAFERAIDAKPTLCEAYKNLGTSYGEIDGRLPEAVGAFEGALRINGEFWPALYSLLDTKQFLCDWRDRATLLHTLTTHLHVLHTTGKLGKGPDERMHGGLAPFITLAMPIPVATQMAVTLNRISKDVDQAAATPLVPPLRWAGVEKANGAAPRVHDSTAKRLRLGLMSSDFGDHPVGHALLPWVRALVRQPRLDVLCFASDHGDRPHVGSELRRDIASACTAFYDVSDLSDEETARVIDDTQPHVLINLVGHTAGCRHIITQWRPAPVQALHYGYPATSGLPAVGYMQLDAVAAPPSVRSDFTEKLAYFPHSHFVAVHARRYPRAISASVHAQPWHRNPEGVRYVIPADDGDKVTRADLGLGDLGSRDSAFALCNFNQLYKLDPETFGVWANSLRRLPAAFLWLSRVSVRKDTSMYAQGHLYNEGAALGMRTDRLAYSFKFPQNDYVPFRALADLMVDNRLYNAHTTGADTLWAGVPAIVTASRHLAGRASASFAHAIGSSHMVAPSWKAYEDTVDVLGRNPQRLWRMRRRLLAMRESAPFFDLDRLAEGQQRLASAMWGVHASGRPPMHVIAARSLSL